MPISKRNNFVKHAIGIRRAWFAKGNRAKRARSSPGIKGIAIKIFQIKTRPEGTRPNNFNNKDIA